MPVSTPDPTPDPLSRNLHEPTLPEVRDAIIIGLWKDNAGSSQQPAVTDWDAYFAYYERECYQALSSGGENLAVRKHKHVVELARCLNDEPTIEDFRDKVRGLVTSEKTPEKVDQMVNGTIFCITRLLAMINVGTLPNEASSKSQLRWDQGSLQETVHDWFNQAPQRVDRSIVIEKTFTARYIDKFSKIDVVLTDNLLDHLRLTNDNKKLWVFHHVAFLKWMEQTKNSMYPENFVEETLETLKLLFPNRDHNTEKWLHHNPLWEQLDKGLLNVGHFQKDDESRRLEHFTFWRDRLGLLVEAVEEVTPTSKALDAILKILDDYDKGQQWFNSSIALGAFVFAVIFSLIQCITGAMQVYKAYHPEAP